MTKRISAFLIVCLCLAVSADVRFGNRVGVGTRANSFAQNYVAIANDLSAVHWNPAALAFLPVREFQISLDGFRSYMLSDVNANNGHDVRGGVIDDYHERIRLANVGIMSALPTVQGGFTLATSYSTPYTFDDFSSEKYNLVDSDGSKNRRVDLIKYGDLRMWSVAFGIQVAPGLSAGLSGSLITGKEHSSVVKQSSYEDDPFVDEKIESGYIGYDFRGGLLYRPNNSFRAGLRVVLPQNIRFKENAEGFDQFGSFRYESDGSMRSAPSGALGVGFVFPWLTISGEGRATMPYTFVYPGEKIPVTSQAKYFKLGGGVGVEVPLVVLPAMVRLGYSYDELDLHDYIYDYDNSDDEMEKAKWFDDGFTVQNDKQTFSAGLGFISSGTGIELSYSYQVWGITHTSGVRVLKQDYDTHCATVSLIVRY